MSFIDPITLWTGPRVSHRGGEAQHGSLSTGVGIYLPRQEFAPTASLRAIAHPAERSFGVDRCDEIPGRHGCAHIRTASNALQVVRSVSALLPPARLLLLITLVVVVRISVLAWPSAELSLSPAQRGLADHTGFHDCPRPVSSKATWWAWQDSNLQPRDSLGPAVSDGSGLSLHPRRRRLDSLRVRDALACYQGPSRHSSRSPQVVSAPSGDASPAWLRVAIGRATGRVP